MSSFNIGFLRAVKGSISESLTSAEKKTQALSADSVGSYDAHVDLHKAIGAMRMIGLEGCNLICTEMERLASALRDGVADLAAGKTALIDAIAAMKRYLDDLLDGAKDIPARMFVQYQAVKVALNADPATPIELFFPSFDAEIVAGEVFAAPALEKLVKQERPKFQGALVKWMKDASNPSVVRESVEQMQAVVDALGAVGGRKAYSQFWFAAGAFLSLLSSVNDDTRRSEFRGVISKLDIEMRKFAEGMKKPADDSFRSMLFYVAQADGATDARVVNARKAFNLDTYWQEVQRGIKESQSTLHLINIDEIKEVLGQAKDELLKVSTGADGDKFKKLCSVLAGKIASFQNPAVKKLSDSVLFVAQKVASKELRLTDMIAEEVAFIFVLLDGLVEKRGRTSPDFDKQVEFEIKRLSAALKNQADVIQQLKSPELDEQSKRENERALIRHTVGEIKADLSQVEEVLDTYFRSNGENSDELAGLRKPLRSSLGAVRILELTGAARILGEIGRLVDGMISGAVLGNDDLGKITEGIGGVSLYLEAYQDGADHERILSPLMELFFAEEVKKQVVAEVELVSVATSIDLVDESQQVVDVDLVEAVETSVFIGIPAVVQVDVQVQAAADDSASGAWDAPSDDELAEVYLEETSEIFATIADTIKVCEAKPHDKEALTTLRRAFHTLKGSGRMVGLKEMGEAAWLVEHFLNKWLSEDRPATRQLLDLVEMSTDHFKGWVADLSASNKVFVNYTKISKALDSFGKPVDPVAVQKPNPTPVVEQIELPYVGVEIEKPADLVVSIAELVIEPVAEVVFEPVAEVVFEPVAEVVIDPVAEVVFEPVAEVVIEPVAEVVFEPAAEVVIEPVAEVVIEPVAEVVIEPAAEVVIEPVAEVVFEPVAEVVIEPVAEVVIEPVDVSLCDEPILPSKDVVTFGDVEISRALFDIFCSESADRLVDLDSALKIMRESSSGEVHETLVRSAHTFGSIGRTVGFPSVSVLGYELEQWAQDKLQNSEGATSSEVDLLSRAIDGIRSMVNVIKSGEAPKGQGQLVAELKSAVLVAKEARAALVHDHSSDLVIEQDIEAIDSSLGDKVQLANLDQVPSPVSLDSSAHVWQKAIDGAILDIEAIRDHLASLQNGLKVLSASVSAGNLDDVKKKLLASEYADSPQQVLASLLSKHLGGIQRALAPIAQTFISAIEAPSIRSLTELRVDLPLAEPVVEEIAEPVVEAVAEPVVEAVAEPVVEAVAEPVVEEIASPVVEEIASPVVEAVAEPVVEEIASPVVEAVADPVVEEIASPVVEAVAEPVVEEIAEPVVEEISEPVVEADYEDSSFDLGAELGLELGDDLGFEIDPSLSPSSSSNSDDSPAEMVELSELEEELAGIENDLDESLLPVFAEEAVDLVPQIGQMIRDLRIAPTDSKLINNLHRALHTVKGSARMVGALQVGALVHHMESMMESAEHGKIAAADIVDLLESQYDRMSTMIDHVLHPEQEVEVRTSVSSTDEVASSGVTEQAQSVQKVVRVTTDIVDRLVNEAGEVRLSGAALSGNMDVMRRSLSELGENAKRLSKMLRELEMQTESQMAARKAAADEHGENFDPLEFDRFTRAQELSRFLAEGMHDIIDVQANLDRLVTAQESVVVHQDQMASDIQQTLMSVRLVKFDTISDRLYKVVRQSAKEMGKKVSLDIVGGNVDVDRGVLDRMVAPLEHLLRNGVAHGIEMPEERKLLGKAEAGLIKMEVIHEGNFVRMRLTDDGQGLNVDVVRKKGLEKGLLSPNVVVGDDKLIELIFMPGFSTADTVSQIAGRGVGMDVVKNEIVSLGGQIEVKTVRMKGMVYDIVLPVSLATTQAILVEASGQLWAIPAEMVEVIDSYKMAKIAEIQSKGQVAIESGSYPYAYLPHLLGERSASPEHKTYNTLVMVRSGDRKIAVHVDRLLGTREIVVKSIGRQMSRISGISGATVMGDGRLGIIINPVYLASNKKDGWMSAIGDAANEKVVRTSRPTVMVVDDSLTIRKATSKLLERSGYDVMVAKDGIDALEVLQERLPDVILSDVEMPRMDGFELLKNLKAEPKYRDIPVVMITSRTADRHKNTGLSLGANVYLGKPYKEDELLGHIEAFLKEKSVA